LLYVAVTRAKHELYLFGHIEATAEQFLQEIKSPKKKTFLSLLWPVLEPQFIRQAQEMLSSTQIVDRLAAATDPAAQRTLRRLPLEWTAPELPSSVNWVPANDPDERIPDDDVTYDWAGEQARRVGTVVHALLQRIAEEGPAAWSELQVREMRPALRSAVANQGVSPADMEDAITRVQSALLAALVDPRGRWILQAHPEAQNEYSLTGLDGGQLYTIAMDRTFIADGVRWIIDYKTSAHEGSDPEAFLDNEVVRYKEKMDRYARILKKQEPGPIRIGLYFPLMRGWREWES
jgi:ATP-dependent exoDNAse (exonuclease V) beta subunit